ncbi:MAG: PspC domain-containing protein [Candidatus Doudnabacteria bacterium]
MQNKKLHLSKEHSLIAGVCGGLAEYFETDPTIIRIIFVFFSFVGGGSIFVYLVLWFFMANKKEVQGLENEVLAQGHYEHHSLG